MSDYTALARDGTVYSCALKIIGDTASVELPDGTNANVQDSRIATLGGGYLFWQIAPTSGTAYASRWENIFAEPAYTGITALTKKRIAFGSDKGLLCDNSCFTYDAANNRIAFVPTWYDTVLGIAWHIYGSSNRNAYIEVTGTGDYRAYMAFGINTSQSDTDAIELMRLTQYKTIQIADGVNIVTNSTTGTKIGENLYNKLGFWGATPIYQPAKANYNNWAALSDVINALVAIGLFDQA